ncbi:MAG: hypothetical protein MZV63_13060 [Marinilabiliales bacterium]|nr:hypothetical protein [Marinilabiliales bacterium]
MAILKGIKEGERVVTSGQLKLKSGSPVVINNHGAAIKRRQSCSCRTVMEKRRS